MDECLTKPEDFNGGQTLVGNLFLASFGVPGLLVSAANETVVRGGSSGLSAGTGIVTA